MENLKKDRKGGTLRSSENIQSRLEFILKRDCNRKGGYQFTSEISKLIRIVSLWLAYDPEFESYGFDLDKGILIVGNTGSGKSSIIRAMSENKIPERRFKVVQTREMQYKYKEYGAQSINRYGRTALVKKRNYQRRSNHAFDGLGEEKDINTWGNQVNVMAEIIMSRYHYFVMGNLLTHFTTTMGSAQLSEFYGDQVFGRLKEMCNFIPMGITEDYQDFRTKKQ